MVDGEPGDRSFDPDMLTDPVAWLGGRLRDVDSLLHRCGNVEGFGDDAEQLRREVDAIAAWVAQGLERIREPWPAVNHDERGLAHVVDLRRR
jgi:hypothetical protein